MVLTRLAWSITKRSGGAIDGWRITPAKQRFVSRMLEEDSRVALLNDAVATRVGTNADEKGWRRFAADLEG